MLGDMRYVSPGEYAAFVTPAIGRDPGEAPPHGAARRRATGFARRRRSDGWRWTSPSVRGGEYGKWLRGHPAVVRINGILFLHGGISPALADSRCDAINATVRRELDRRHRPDARRAAREPGDARRRALVVSRPGPAAGGVRSPAWTTILARQGARAIVIAPHGDAGGPDRAPASGARCCRSTPACRPATSPTAAPRRWRSGAGRSPRSTPTGATCSRAAAAALEPVPGDAARVDPYQSTFAANCIWRLSPDRRGDAARRRRSDVRVREAELRGVEQVEGVGAELQVQPVSLRGMRLASETSTVWCPGRRGCRGPSCRTCWAAAPRSRRCRTTGSDVGSVQLAVADAVGPGRRAVVHARVQEDREGPAAWRG